MMNNKKLIKWIAGLGIFGLMFCICTLFDAIVFARDIILVCNNSVPVESLDKKEVRNIFLGKEIEWDNNEKIVLAVLKAKDLHKQFLDAYIGMTTSKYRTYWKQMIFTGKTSSSPKIMKSEDDLLEYIAETPGGIGYVSADVNTEDVKVISDKSE